MLAGDNLLVDLTTIQADAALYFDEVGAIGLPALEDLSARSRFGRLPAGVQAKANAITSTLIALASRVGPALRRSPLLSELDAVNAGHDIKQMRSAIYFAKYLYCGPEILHDEGTFLGVQPGWQSDDEPIIDFAKAKQLFARACDILRRAIELVGKPASSVGIDLTVPEVAAGPAIRPNTAFIMMAMEKGRSDLDDVADTIKRACKAFGITAMRADDIEHEDVITKRIIDQIRTSEFLLADLTRERPSVYYEVGYAHALGRRVILYRKEGTNIHFDLAAYNCPEYPNLRGLENMLVRRLETLTGQRPTGSVRAASGA